MGNQNTNKKDTVDIQLSHPKFVNAKLIKDKQNVQLQTKLGVEEKDFHKWVQKIKDHKVDQYTHLLLPVHQEFASNNLCGSNGTATINYDYYPYLLSQQIYNRSGKKTKFEQTDLWYLLFSLVSAKNQIRNSPSSTSQPNISSSLGDIRANNIFLNDQGKVKIANLLSFPNEQSTWEKALDKTAGVYLAPQDFERLARGQSENQNSDSQIFAIGMVMLNSGILLNEGVSTEKQQISISTPHLYDYKKMEFNHVQYERRLLQWIFGRGYSDILKATVLNLVDIHPQTRLTAAQLWQFISKHVKSIQNRQNFVIDNAPLKIHSSVGRYRQIKGKGNPRQVVKQPYLEKSVVVKHQISDISLHEKVQRYAQHQATYNPKAEQADPNKSVQHHHQ